MELIEKVPGDHSNVPVGSCITDPFAVITEESNTLHVNATRAAHAPQDQPPEANGINASLFAFFVGCCSKFGDKVGTVTPHR